MMYRTELRQRQRTGAVKTWSVEANKNQVITVWGQIDGAKQTTTQTFEGVNIGKANEKAPAEVAEDWAQRQVLLKLRKGYIEVQEDGSWKEDVKTFQGFTDIPETLRWYKPQNSVNPHMLKKMRNMEAMYLRKRDGNMHFITTGDNGENMYMYSSTSQKVTEHEPTLALLARYQQIRSDLEELNLPPKTIILGELVTVDKDAYGFQVDDLEYVSGIRGSLREESIKDQEADRKLGFCIWDISFYAGENILDTRTFRERWEILSGIEGFEYISIPDELTLEDIGGQIVPSINGVELQMDPVEGDIEDISLAVAESLGWEGWVVIDPDEIYGDKSYNFRGKPERPKFVVKHKPQLEADFIVRFDPDNGVGRKGKGKKSVGVGSVQAYLTLPGSSDEVPVALVGGGLSKEQVLEFADTSRYPQVWKVGFASWTRKGSVQFPKFLMERDDKGIDECSIEQNPNWEKTEWQ